MAIRTSSQSGNFNATSTWGGSAVPVDGDQFVVSAGHIVTVNDDRRVTNGYHNSTISGKLHITGSGQLRMNGTLDVISTGTTDYFTENDSATGAYFKMENGAILEMKGESDDNHYLKIHAQKYNWIEFDGTNPNSKTTTASDTAINSSSISLTSSTGFAAGDWINVYTELENIDSWSRDNARDEGMIVHDVDGNTIYTRWFVSPTATINVKSGNKLQVSDSAVFRVGQQIIFGTGANRNVRTITDIKNVTNKIVLNSNVTGDVVGETIYRSSTEFFHESGQSVQKVATPMTGGGAVGSRTIQVASTAGMAVGKRVLIEVNNNSDTNWDYEMLYEIESIDGNTVILTENFANERIAGAWVTIFDRDTQVRSTDIGNSDQRVYILQNRWTSSSGYYRRLRFRNVLFEGIGSNAVNSTWNRGVGWNGHVSYENDSHGQYASGVDGCVWTPNNRGGNSAWYSRDAHQCTQKNCIGYNSHLNYWRYSTNNNFNFNNNIGWRASYASYQSDSGQYEPRFKLEYNHFSRSDDYGLMVYHQRSASGSIRHNRITHHEQRPVYTFYNSHNVIWENNYINWFRSWPYIGGGGDWILLNCYLGNDWDATTGNITPVPGVQIQQLGDLRPDRANHPQSAYSINHNWREGDTVQWGAYMWRKWDEDESAWKVFRDTATDNAAGQSESVYVPAGATVHVAGEIKLSSGFSGNIPYLRTRAVQNYDGGKYSNGDAGTSNQQSQNSPNTYTLGHIESAQFTSSADGAYERKTLEISPVNYDYYLSVSIYSDNQNAADNLEHWHQKPIEIYLNKGSKVKEKRFLVQQQSKVGFNETATRRRTRLGGRIK